MLRILFSTVRLTIELVPSFFSVGCSKYKSPQRILESFGCLVSAPSGRSYSYKLQKVRGYVVILIRARWETTI